MKVNNHRFQHVDGKIARWKYAAKAIPFIGREIGYRQWRMRADERYRAWRELMKVDPDPPLITWADAFWIGLMVLFLALAIIAAMHPGGH